MKEQLKKLTALLENYNKTVDNPTREKLIEDAVRGNYANVMPQGTLYTWTPAESTGRSPKDTYVVKRPEVDAKIDWDASYNIPMDPETFEMIFEDALDTLKNKKKVYKLNRVIGANSNYALPTVMVTDNPLNGLFADNMFRPVPEDIEKSIFSKTPFTLISLPYDKLSSEKYEGRLRKLPGGKTSGMAVAMDYEKKVGIVYGSAYQGSNKKLMFTVMNFLLPDYGILPLHCSANEGKNGDSALLLGLSGTGKTTLSADPERALLGDDEHGWGNDGIANFENGCYAKLIDLSPAKEPEIYKATFHYDHYLNHGSIVENLMVYPDGTLDFEDSRYTENSRASYPLKYLTNTKESSTSGHPKTILFLTADAYGVLPPISKLTREQAMFWFMMGYTSKLAGTETGITEPQATFSRFFGGPFMPRNPGDYAELLGKKMDEHNVNIFLVNTGWSGGAYGVGKRMNLKYTRAMVSAALNGNLNDVDYVSDDIFGVQIPTTCPNVPTEIMIPRNSWKDKDSFDKTAKNLASKFVDHFEKQFKGKVSDEIASACPKP